MGITTWDNPYLLNNLYELKDTNTRDIQERIIHMNKHENLIIFRFSDSIVKSSIVKSLKIYSLFEIIIKPIIHIFGKSFFTSLLK